MCAVCHIRPFTDPRTPARAISQLFVIVILLLSGPSGLFGQCIDTSNFYQWFEANGDNNWQINSASEVSQNIEIVPTRPSFFISEEQMINVRFSFDVECTSGHDDDFIGFVAGYRNPYSASSEEYNFILFDWKAKAEVGFSHFAEEGFTLAAYHGHINPEDIHDYSWGHNSAASTSIYEPLAQSFGDGKGWQDNKKYHFEVFYMETSIKILIDNKPVFDVERCNQAGRIGFYSYSQYDVNFSNLTYRRSADLFASPAVICSGQKVFTSLTDPSCPGYAPVLESWQWNWGDGVISENTPDDQHIYPSAGTYTLELIARFPGGCADTLVTPINVQSPPVVDLGPDTTIYAGGSITLSAGDYQLNREYLWSTGSEAPQITLNNLENDTLISVLVTGSICQGYDEINIFVVRDTIPLYNIRVPNVFTPDGDGLNDVFRPVIMEELQDQYDLFIYDKWGTQIFNSTQPEEGWDGTYKGRPCQGDVYVYLIKYHLPARFQVNETSIIKGCLLLLR